MYTVYCELLVVYLDLNDQLAVANTGKDVAPPVLGTLVLTSKHKYYFGVMILFRKKPQTTKQTKPQTKQKPPKQSPKQTNQPTNLYS